MSGQIQPHAERHAAHSKAAAARAEAAEARAAARLREDRAYTEQAAAAQASDDTALAAADVEAVRAVRLATLGRLMPLAFSWAEDPSRAKADAIRSALIEASADSRRATGAPVDPWLCAIAFAGVEIKKDPDSLEVFVRQGLLGSASGKARLGVAVSQLRQAIDIKAHVGDFESALGELERAIASLSRMVRNPVPADADQRWAAICECTPHAAQIRLRELDLPQQQAAAEVSAADIRAYQDRLARIAKFGPSVDYADVGARQ